eukprot:TRINITY_DN4058_c0_g1_i3.p1 TRINITY_DN4058_c0_g1~~TRINITY_DN4058_c0_g1_i3.p1  ORF type:complete len:350 (+),score=46.19 TRINITY_DN4058_c0_g1_i3:369-1418(+)
MFYFRAWFQDTEAGAEVVPITRIVPQNWDPTTGGNNLFLSSCSSTSPMLSWNFSTVGKAFTITSVTLPGFCVKGEPNVFPARLVLCDVKDPSFLFYTDSFGQIYFLLGNDKYCMDIEANVGPSVGFYSCKNSVGTNQDWKINTLDGHINSLFSSDLCVALGHRVDVYTNGDSVKLVLNDVVLETQTVEPYGIAQFLVPSFSGRITAVASKGGKFWGTDTVESVGTPVQLVLKIDSPKQGNTIFSCGQDSALLRVSVVDEHQRVVRSATNLVTFSVSENGRVLGTGNGDPSDHYPDQGNQRRLWNGLARVIVLANRRDVAGTLIVTASSPGLGSATVSITTLPHADSLLL